MLLTYLAHYGGKNHGLDTCGSHLQTSLSNHLTSGETQGPPLINDIITLSSGVVGSVGEDGSGSVSGGFPFVFPVALA